MDIKTFAKKLRHAADALDEILEVKGTVQIAEKITTRLEKRGRKKAAKMTLHWSKLPENRLKAARWRRHMSKAIRTVNASRKVAVNE